MRRLLVALACAALLAVGLTAPSQAHYALNQWHQPDGSTCVQISTSNTTLRSKVDWAAYQLSSKTDLTMWDSSSCAGNKITVRAGHYGTSWKNYSRAVTQLWVSGRTIVRADVYINLSYSISGIVGNYVILHELIHGVLGTRHSSSCYSIMAATWTFSCDVWWLTADARNAINHVY